MLKLSFIISTAMLALASHPAGAEEVPVTTTLLGLGAWSRPAYEGSDSKQTVAIPVIRYYGTPWFMRTTFGMLEGGARTEVLSGFTLGAQLAYEGGRNSADSAFLSSHNLPTIDPSLSWGVHAELEKNIGPMPLIVLLRYRQHIESKCGEQTDLRVTAGILSYGGINAGIFAQTTWANSKSLNYFYGIDAQQAVTTGLSAYDASAGELYSSTGFLWSYEVDPKWMLLGSFEYRQLRGSSANSPLVQINSGQYASVGLAYQF